ncbi:hypothetical protein [Streptacidiphilus albus]|uniref:hypothetical protein n=1 Tax=Streptacidiphilus albus TaxID=105425 RepID=UPI00054BB2AC|nr:hypothetical protein [Streptacidiphilus albus]
MLGWTVFVVVYVLLAGLWGLGMRRFWRRPPSPVAMGSGWFAAESRGNQRAIIPTGVMFFALVGAVAAVYAAGESHGLVAAVFSLVTAAFGLIMMVSVVFIGTVRWFNWPRALVHPGSREDPGMGVELKERWLSRKRRR